MTVCPPPIASTARSTGSASITIPGPPPYASSSVERWRSLAYSRRSHTRTSMSPAFTPRAITPSARKESNIRGKIVTKSIRNIVDILQPLGDRDDDPFVREVDLRADVGRERQIERFSVRTLHAEEDSGAPFVRFDDDSALMTFGIDERQSGEIVQVILVGVELARDALVDLDRPVVHVAQLFGRAELAELHERALFVRADALDRRGTHRFFVRRNERHVFEAGDALDRIGPDFDARFA